ncbi:hypothetical protein LguiA_027350 [Lonicera macranthoides]
MQKSKLPIFVPSFIFIIKTKEQYKVQTHDLPQTNNIQKVDYSHSWLCNPSKDHQHSSQESAQNTHHCNHLSLAH